MTYTHNGEAMSPRHYRPPTKPLATAWARHLDRVMRTRDLSQTNVFDSVREAMGYAPTSRSAVLRVFSDRDPSPELAAELTRLYGAPEPEVPAPVAEVEPSERAMLAAAMDRQSAAMEVQAAAFTRLAESIDQAASSVTGRVAGFDDLLRGLLVALGGQASGAPAEGQRGQPAVGR